MTTEHQDDIFPEAADAAQADLAQADAASADLAPEKPAPKKRKTRSRKKTATRPAKAAQGAEEQDAAQKTTASASFMDLVRQSGRESRYGPPPVSISEFEEGETVWAVNRTGSYMYMQAVVENEKFDLVIPVTGPHPIPISNGTIDAPVPQVPLRVLKTNPRFAVYLNGRLPQSEKHNRNAPLQLMRNESVMKYYSGMAGSSDPADAVAAFQEIVDKVIRKNALRAAGLGSGEEFEEYVLDRGPDRAAEYLSPSAAEFHKRMQGDSQPQLRRVSDIRPDDVSPDMEDGDLTTPSKTVQSRVVDLCRAHVSGKVTPKQFANTLSAYSRDGVRLSYEDALYAFDNGPAECRSWISQLARDIDPSKPELYRVYDKGKSDHVYGTTIDDLRD